MTNFFNIIDWTMILGSIPFILLAPMSKYGIYAMAAIGTYVVVKVIMKWMQRRFLNK
jgi:hypothetical protein